jgi:hypothetical protein
MRGHMRLLLRLLPLLLLRMPRCLPRAAAPAAALCAAFPVTRFAFRTGPRAFVVTLVPRALAIIANC